MKNKDMYEELQDAKREYYRQLEKGLLTVSFEGWLFKEVNFGNTIDGFMEGEEKTIPDEKGCDTCRYYFNGRCLLGKKNKYYDNSCKQWKEN